LSAVAAVESKDEGMQMYAEDYIVKPFEKEELVARVQRVLRRYGESAGVEQPEIVIDQDLQINFVQHWARVKGQQVTLTPTESKLLFLLVRNAGRVVTNETLLAKAWAGDEEAYEEGLRVHISRLRSKIEPNPSKPVYIQTKRGVGYRFGAKVNYPAGQEPLALATRHRPLPVFLGAAAAFVIQSAVAVAAGSLLGLLPREPIRIGAGVLFLVMATLLVRQNLMKRGESNDQHELEREERRHRHPFVTAFTVVFVAEWGDLTQLATAALQARYQSAVVIFVSATLALWT